MTNQEIITRGELIRDETVTGANTAQRVGEAFVGIGQNLEELANRDEPIVFTESKEMNALIRTLYLDIKNYNGEAAIDTNSIYCKYFANNHVLGFYTAASGGTNFLNIILNESVVCATISNGIYYYVDIDYDALPDSDTNRFKIKTSAFSEAFNPKNLNDGYTTNPVLNKYIKQIWVEIPDDYSGEVIDILNKLCIYSLSNLLVNGEYKQKLTISVFGSGYATFYFSNGVGENSTLDIAGYQTYSELTLHIDIDWKSLRGKEYKNRYDYLTQKAYDKNFFVRRIEVSDETGESSDIAISQKWAKGVDDEINEIKAQLPEITTIQGEFTPNSYYSTAGKTTIGESGQTSLSQGDSTLSSFMLPLNDNIVSVYLKVGGTSTQVITLRPYYFLDEDNNLLFIENDTTNIIERTITKDEFPVNPNNGKAAKYLYVNNYANKVASPSVSWKTIGDNQDEDFQEQIDELRQAVPPTITMNGEYILGYYDFNGKNVGVDYSAIMRNSTTASCIKFKIEDYHETIIFKCRGTSYIHPFCLLDEENILLYKETSNGVSSAETFRLTREGKDLILNTGNQTVTISSPKWLCVNNYNNTFASPTFVCSYNKFNQIYNAVCPSYISPYLFGKKLLMLGDSITEFTYNRYYGVEPKGIVEHFAEYTKANVVRGGIGASGLTRRADVSSTVNTSEQAYANLDVPSILDALCTGNWDYVDAGVTYLKENTSDDNENIINGLKNVDMDKVDIITIFAGTNDWRRSRLVVGENSLSNLTDIANINGAINYIVKTIHEAYPNIAIYFFTPIVRALSRSGDIIDNFSDDVNVVMTRPSGWEGEPALHLYDIANAIADAAKRNHCPCCNLYYEMGWDKYNFVQFLGESVNANNTPNTDGTHPVRGFAAIAHKMATFILSNICR